ncbi:MAG: hypothetical protein JNK87_00470, partial [Bryobacterales bacterium]|nr:hypothetical protein [Bryobacterales bacterium]
MRKLAMGVLGFGALLGAQEHDVLFERAVPAPRMAFFQGVPAADAAPPPHHGATFAFITAADGGGRPVKGAPYTGEGTTETVRILADGTRITNKNTTVMARDAEGRTRRETSLSHIGPWANGEQAVPRFVTITDPVSKETFVLNLTDRTATKSKMGEPLVFRHETQEGTTQRVTEQRVSVRVSGSGTGTADVVSLQQAMPAIPAMPVAGVAGVQATRVMFDTKNMKTENLGTQSMDGVKVEGTRTTHTIPAGEIGNDRAIVSTTERWYSPDLQMVIYSKTVDP